MLSKKKLIVLTGAGVSAESGISTFRDNDGLWEQYPVEEVASIEGFQRNPQLVLNFYNERRRRYKGCQPNNAHYTLAKLEEYFDVRIITQNVDDLHEQAGSSKVIHLHGELMKNCSVNDTSTTYPVDPNNSDIHIGDLAPDGFQLRPFIVWFGEAVPMIEPAIEWVQTADFFAVIGSSLLVYPAAGLLHYVPSDSPIYVIDPKEVTANTNREIHFIREKASTGVNTLAHLLGVSF